MLYTITLIALDGKTVYGTADIECKADLPRWVVWKNKVLYLDPAYGSSITYLEIPSLSIPDSNVIPV